MALLHRAELHPTKLELVSAWLPGHSWYQAGDGGDIARVAAYRFDDPAGEVGIETLLVRSGDGPTYQVPLTYRGTPLEGGDAWLIGTTEHSVLGSRWVYDACGDPVYVAELAGAVLSGAAQVEEYIEIDGELVHRESSMTVIGSGSYATVAPGAIVEVVDGDPTRIVTEAVELAVVRRPGSAVGFSGATLTGTWPGQAMPLTLAYGVPR